MAGFDRRLSDLGFDQLQHCEQLPWFRDLLLRWQPPGDALASFADGGTKHLRLVIRDGYLNFYRLGQSVAKVGFSQTGVPEASIHNKYVEDSAGDQSYVLLTGDRLRSAKGDDLGAYTGPEQLDGWIEEAEEYSGREKCFVDKVVACNANVIDLEMGLPAVGDAKTAPRLDLVALEEAADSWRIVFWEAKLMATGVFVAAASTCRRWLPSSMLTRNGWPIWEIPNGSRRRTRRLVACSSSFMPWLNLSAGHRHRLARVSLLSRLPRYCPRSMSGLA